MAALTAPLVGAKGTVELRDDVWALPPNASLLHQVVKAELNAARRGTHATKSRGMVAGGGAKPWRQKGTGRARQGTIRAPQWKGGGVTFGPQPRSYEEKVNKKARQRAIRIALSQHAARGTLGVFDATTFEKPGTKAAVALLAGWKTPRPALVVVSEDELNAGLSFRNLERVAVGTTFDVGVAELLWARALLLSKGALALLQGEDEEPA